jgi:tyrosyl-tRNA synthetase
VRNWKQEVADGRNPRDIKAAFAQEIVERFHGPAAGRAAVTDFEARFRQGAIPDEMPEVTLPAESGGVAIAHVLKHAGLAPSTSEALRLIGQGGVKIDGEKVTDKALVLGKGERVVLQVGKRKFARVTIT